MSTRTEPPRILHENQQDNQQVLRTISPSRSFGTYDRYVPPRSSTSYRDDYTYRASSWRPNERPPSYYNRSPSPNRYDTRDLEDPWTRSPYSWQDRRPSDLWSLDRRRDSGPERPFEPSEVWKQSHNDWRVRQDLLPPHSGDRYLPNYSRDSRDYNQTPRSHGSDHYTPLSPSGDRYRPYPDQYDSREFFSHSRPDSYRPQYGDDGFRGLPYASSLRASRMRSPDEEESPRREPRPHIHRLPISYADRESRHYSPTRPISPRDGRSSSPTAVRSNNGRNNSTWTNEFIRRASLGRRSRSPTRSIKQEHSPPIPGLVGTKSTFARNGIQGMNLLTGASPKRRSESPYDNELPHKRARSISPQSSIASSRQSSPAPIIVIAKTNSAVVPSPAHCEKSPYRNDSVPENVLPTPPATSPPQEDARGKISQASTSLSSPRPSIPGLKDPTDIIIETSNINTVPVHSNQNASSVPASLPPRSPIATTSINLPESLLPAAPSVPTKPSIIVADDPMHKYQVEVTDVSLQQEEEGVRPEVIRHSTSYSTKSIREALKHVVMTRHLHDHHRRNERVEPILLSNLSIAERFEKSERASPESLIQDILEGACQKARRDTFEQLKPSFEAVLEHRRSALSEKVQQLRSEYLELHHRWMEHCSKLDEAAKTFSNEDTVATTGRTTRRSAATLGDAVRSDLEMEQIIASLGNEDLTDANHLAMRNAAIIPDMISVTRGQLDYLFDDTNNWVADPAEFYAQRTGIDDWTDEEKQVFSEQYAAYPKQFGTISEMLPNKTTAQCVAFYYLHKKKHIDFRKVIQRYAPNKRRGGRKTDKQRGNALLSDIRKHDAETGPKDNDIPDPGLPKKRRPGRPPGRKNGQVELTPATTPTPAATPDPDPVPVPRSRGGRRLNMRGPVIIEDVTEEEEDPKPAKKVGRRARKPKPVKPASSEEVTPAPEYQDVVGRRKTNVSNTQWPEDDQKLFIELVAQHGDNFKRIAASMPNKTTVQVSVFYNANVTRLDLDKVAASAPHRTPTPPSFSDPAPPQAPAVPVKSLRPRDRSQDARRAVLEYPGSGVMSPYRSSQTSSPPPPRPMYSSDQRQDPSILLSLGQESSWPTYGPYQGHSVHPTYMHPHPSIQREPYFPSQQIPYNYQHHHQQSQQHHHLHPPLIIVPEAESGSVPVQGDSFFINDYQHSRGPPQTQSSSMGVIPGLMNVNVPDFDPQYHQPVIRVQHQDSHHEPPTTSSFMTGRVLLSTKAYNGRS